MLRGMRKVLHLIYAVTILMMLTQCSNNSDPEPVPGPEPQSEIELETWQLTYHDYHFMLYGDSSSCPKDYLNLTREVNVIRNDTLFFKEGILAEYPDAWTKFTIKDSKLYCKTPQLLETENGKSTYLYWGHVNHDWSYGHSFNVTTISFIPETEGATFTLSDDGNVLTSPKRNPYDWSSFWYSMDESGRVDYDSGSYGDNEFDVIREWRGTGFPDVGYMINLTLKRISDN